MKQLLSITLAFTLVRLISQPGAAQPAQPSPTPGGRGGRGGGTPPPIQAKPEELAKIKEKNGQIDALVKELKAKRASPELVGDVDALDASMARAGIGPAKRMFSSPSRR